MVYIFIPGFFHRRYVSQFVAFMFYGATFLAMLFQFLYLFTVQ